MQALNEFTRVARRKLRWHWPEVEAALAVIAELAGPVRPLTPEIHGVALQLARDDGLSFYDALVVAAAADAGCRVLLTEDLHHGRKVAGVTIKNPFTAQA